MCSCGWMRPAVTGALARLAKIRRRPLVAACGRTLPAPARADMHARTPPTVRASAQATRSADADEPRRVAPCAPPRGRDCVKQPQRHPGVATFHVVLHQGRAATNGLHRSPGVATGLRWCNALQRGGPSGKNGATVPSEWRRTQASLLSARARWQIRRHLPLTETVRHLVERLPLVIQRRVEGRRAEADREPD
jgi:hypothetical protein